MKPTCGSVFLLQHIQDVLARTVVQAPKFKHITPILKFFHRLKVSERIEYKIISFTYEILNTTQPPYLYDLVSSQPPHGHSTRSSHYVCHSHQTIIITQSHSSIFPTCFTSSLEPAPYITQNSSSELFIPLSATFI